MLKISFLYIKIYGSNILLIKPQFLSYMFLAVSKKQRFLRLPKYLIVKKLPFPKGFYKFK